MGQNSKKTVVKALLSVSALALGAVLISEGATDGSSVFVKSAFAESHSGGGQGQGQGQGGQGGQGQGGQGGQGGHSDGGHDDGGHTDGGHDDGGHTGGNSGNRGGVLDGVAGMGGAGAAGGPSEESDGQGPRAGQAGSGGGKPIWAAEGIPEVELGRLSVARSPDQVLNRALDEALSNFTPAMVDFYNLPLSEAIVQLSTNFDNLSFIDSPLQNLALFKDALDGTTVLSSLGVTNSTNTLLAVFLGTASDKTLPITADTAFAVVKILTGVELTAAQAAALAANAEAVRIAVLAGHG